jgi:hypothetical protein
MAGADNDWVIWGRWFLADPSTRTISPFSKVTIAQYVENLLEENDPTVISLDEAESLAAGNSQLLAKIAAARKSLESKTKQ